MSIMHSVLIDHRERQSRLASHLLADSTWSVAFGHLIAGDYLIDERWLVERKSLMDLVESIKDGRLFRQAIRMAALVGRHHRRRRAGLAQQPDLVANKPTGRAHDGVQAADAARTSEVSGVANVLVSAAALLVEGRVSDLRDSGMSAESIRAALASVSVFVGIPVLRTTHARESAELLKSIATQGRANAGGGLPRMGVRPTGKRRLQLHLLQGLPGVGPERAARLLNHFGNVRAVATASEQELLAVAGIGSGCARRILWSLGEEVPAYGADTHQSAWPPAGAGSAREL